MALSYRHIIRQAYLDILERPADDGGLEHYNALMNPPTNLTEVQLRASLATSPEYGERFKEVPPPPPPPPGSIAPLRVAGNRFTAGGSPINLLGMILCCCSEAKCEGPENEAIAHGWPSILDNETLDLMKENGLNWCHVRTGPFRVARPGEPDSGETPLNVAYIDAGDGRVNLDEWNPFFFTRLRNFLGEARARKIYVELDLYDVWVAHHEVGPFSAAGNVNGFDKGGLGIFDSQPHARHEAWLRKIIRETREFDNVVYHTGNEMWKARTRANIGGWVRRMYDIVQEETGPGSGFVRKLLGDNSDTRPDFVDYWTLHKREAQPAEEKPVLVNEYPSQPPHVVVGEVMRARAMGTYFMYWRGGHTWDETRMVCAQLKTILEGGQPFPDSCPVLIRWQPKVHIVMNRHRQQIESGVPEEGGFVFFDSTPRFGSGNGRPCNAEHNVVCGGRPCEDPRGGQWTLTEGSAQVRVENPGDNGHGYQVLLGPLGPGGSRYTLRVQALSDARDALGKPLQVNPNHAREVTIVVGERATAAASDAAVFALGSVAALESFRPIPPGILGEEPVLSDPGERWVQGARRT